MGWRVPQAGKGDPWQTLYFTAKVIVNGTWDTTNKGTRWSAPAISGSSAWHPTSGLHKNDSGRSGDYGTRGLFWAVESGKASHYFNVVQNATFLNRRVHMPSAFPSAAYGSSENTEGGEVVQNKAMQTRTKDPTGPLEPGCDYPKHCRMAGMPG